MILINANELIEKIVNTPSKVAIQNPRSLFLGAIAQRQNEIIDLIEHEIAYNSYVVTNMRGEYEK